VSAYDIAILGSSPNALSAAARLSREGRRVIVLETRGSVGGPVATEAFAPGFRADTGVMSAALDPEVSRDLGVEIDTIRRDTVTALGPSPLTLQALPPPQDAQAAARSVLPELPQAVEHAVDLLRAIHRSEPPTVPASSGVDADALRAIGARLLGLGPREMFEVLRLVFMSSRDFVEEQPGLSRAARAILCAAAVRGVSEGPFAPGTMFNFLHREAVGDGLFPSSARGGLQSLSQALADKARAHGAEIRVGVPGPLSVIIEGGAARGALLGGGERVDAVALISDYDARATFTRLVPAYELDPEVNRAVRNLRYKGSVARVHLALRALPEFTGVDPGALRGTLVLAPDAASIERAWDQAKRGATPAHPLIEVTLPSVSDPSLAPEGQHVLSAWVQYVPYGRGDREALLKTFIAELASHAPEIAGQVIHHEVSLPEDLERRFGLTEGHLYGGELSLAQAFFLRPIPGYAHYESPIQGLYLGGSAAHPGGYSGLSGWSLAGALLARVE
jgi:phytoene dehydrogenase-like protein